MHHLRAAEQPFIVFEPGNRMTYLRDLDHRSLARPGSSSHWPVGRILSDGRTAQAKDRATSFLGFPISEPPRHDGPDGRSYICSLYGMTDQPFDELLTLARSWSAAPAMTIDSDDFAARGFDRCERLYRVDRVGNGSTIDMLIDASVTAPLVNIPLLIRNWGAADATLSINEVAVSRGGDFRFAHRHGLDGTDLLVWIAHEANSSTRLTLRATGSRH
jgi:hypothetical protein